MTVAPGIARPRAAQPRPTVVGQTRKRAQTAALAAIVLWITDSEGVYRVSVYHQCTTAGAVTVLATTIRWTDARGAQSATPAANISLTGTNGASGAQFIQCAVATKITVETALTGVRTTDLYALDVIVERLS